MLWGGPWGPFLESLGVLWNSLGAFGACLGSSSGSFGEPWGRVWAPLEVLGVCFADPWNPWGLLGRSRADFWDFLTKYGSPSGSISGSFWDVFSSRLKRPFFH